MKRLYTIIALLSLTLLAVSCGGGARRHARNPNPFNPVYKIAILPLYNDTSSVKGPVMVRKGIFKRLERYHYSIKPLEETDKILRDRLGVTLGKQIPLVDIERLRDELDVDALLYGYLLNFDSVTLGVYNARKVRAAFRLVDAGSGETIWSRGQGVQIVMRSKGTGSIFKDSKSEELPARIPGLKGIPGADKWKTLKKFKDVRGDVGFAIGLTELLVTKTLRINLRYETGRMLDIIVRDFPAGPGRAVVYTALEGSEDVSEETKSSLLYPVPYLGLKDKDDFTASINMVVTDKESAREDHFRIIIKKRGGDIRSAYTGEDGKDVAVIITKADGDDILLYPKEKKFILMSKGSKSSEEVISKEPAGVEASTDSEGKHVRKYKVTVSKDAVVLRRGYVWESEGFPVKADFEDDDSKTVMVIEGLHFQRSPGALFEIPEDYTETNPYRLMNED